MNATNKAQRSEQQHQGGAGAQTRATPTVASTQNGQAGAGADALASTKTSQPAAGRLVFGLSARTNRLKHDEYAEKRSGNTLGSASSSNSSSSGSGGQQQQSNQKHTRQPQSEPAAAAQPHRTAASAAAQQQVGNRLAATNASPATNRTISNNRIAGQSNASANTITMSNDNGPAPPEKPVSRSSSSGSSSTAANKARAAKQHTNSTTTTTPSATTNSSNATQLGQKLKPNDLVVASRPAVAESTSTTTSTSSKRPATSVVTERAAAYHAASQSRGKSPDRAADAGGRQQQAEAAKTATTTTTMRRTPEPPPAASSTRAASPAPPEPASPVKAAAAAAATVTAAPRMQFNIPPPPKISAAISSATKLDSVVSYAKSRIYDKPVKQILSNPPAPVGVSLLNSGAVPESILSGFKPPKQVNVSRAREKWEGGEPFARCKSRQRLAAKAGKKLLHGTWSMTSVVATQQLQLQQALAQSSAGVRSSLIKSDPSVERVLTRGSVLERVQQFEKAPGANPVGASGGLFDYDLDDDEFEACLTMGESAKGLADTTSASPAQPTSKQAIYKTRVSSIQSSTAAASGLTNQPKHEPLLATALTRSGLQSLPTGGAAGAANQVTGAPGVGVRRLSLRRRSSTANSSSLNSSIPRFYHPNGKLNTYEIELQKKNIVACFDKFPDRKALLSGPNCRRHFHSIALACGFSEYFKEPLCLYVKHQLTQTKLLLGTAPAPRKQSSAGMTNGTSPSPTSKQQPSLAASQPAHRGGKSGAGMASGGHHNPLARAASIDTSTLAKVQGQNYISCDQFLVCWRQIIGSCFDQAARFVHLLTLGQRNYLLPDDLVPLIQSVIDDHPGLKFLRAAPDFHMRYVQTVIARIYYCVNKSWTGKISVAELRQSNLLAVLQVLAQEEDINQITDYFSYEHFYVIYCKFWALDQDHDLWISKEDLARHNEAAISSRIIERIFMGIVSRQIGQTGKMSYSDFVWFLLAEEDKKHPRAIEYWFRLMDLDGDGYISMYEMEYFYYEQTKRLELMNIEALPFVDSACQILDLVNPKEKNKISLSDLKRTKMATIFFDTFINLEKYLEHESREFVSTRDVVQDGVVISDWDRYASEEYESLVTEESSV